MSRYKYLVKVTPLSSFPDRYYLEYFDTEQQAKDFIDFILTTADKAVMIDVDEERNDYNGKIQNW